jgi:hypothetical protein
LPEPDRRGHAGGRPPPKLVAGPVEHSATSWPRLRGTCTNPRLLGDRRDRLPHLGAGRASCIHVDLSDRCEWLRTRPGSGPFTIMRQHPTRIERVPHATELQDVVTHLTNLGRRRLEDHAAGGELLALFGDWCWQTRSDQSLETFEDWLTEVHDRPTSAGAVEAVRANLVEDPHV